jgi:hypothetical protein
MTVRVPRLPLSLDPLIAEAKRRARHRRLLVAAAVAMLAGGAAWAAITLSGSTAAHGSGPVVPAATRTPLPPLSGLAARANWCGDAYNASGRGGCHSPDGKWAIVVDNQGTGCTLTVTRIGTGRHERIGRTGSCAPDLWIGHSFVVQGDIYGPRGRVFSIEPPSRHVNVLARFRTFVVSPNERWIAGEARASSLWGPRVVAVVSLTNGTCRVVARATSPSQAVSVDKSPWSIRPALPTTPFKQVVIWRTVHRGGRKVRVVSGPGTGFTRNSRSVIVARWEHTDSPPYAIHKRLVKLDLSSLHTPCPPGLAPRG